MRAKPRRRQFKVRTAVPAGCGVALAVFRALALATTLLACRNIPHAHAADLAGRYLVASLPNTSEATLASAIYAGTTDIAARNHGYAVTWHLRNSARRLRGLGFPDADNLVGVSISTGGAAYGVAIYRRVDAAHEWQGRWISSIDSGNVVGEIRFDDPGDHVLPGRHHLVCRRPGSGGFEGAVNITAVGENYALTFETDRTVLYRGVGILIDKDRLVVGWSFGSPPALAAYRLNAEGLLTGRRVNPRAQEPTVRDVLARDGDEALRLLPVAARTDPALIPSDADASLEPGSPEIKGWNYEDLTERYGADGWARRWLDEQLTVEEHALLDGALKRRRRRVSSKLPPHPTIGQLIEEQRQCVSD